MQCEMEKKFFKVIAGSENVCFVVVKNPTLSKKLRGKDLHCNFQQVKSLRFVQCVYLFLV